MALVITLTEKEIEAATMMQHKHILTMVYNILNKYVLKSFLLLLCMLLVQGCEKAAICDCFKGTGKEVTEERSASPFHYIEMQDKVDLYVHYDNTYRITVTAGENVIDKVITEIAGGVIRLGNKNRCNWVRDFQNRFIVHIYTPLIDTVEVINSSGNVYFVDTMYAGRFQFESWTSTGNYDLKLNCGTVFLALQTGPASLNAHGYTGVAYLWNSGGGRFDAKDLTVNDIYCTNLGTNDLLLKAMNRLYAKLNYSGNIYYKGTASDLVLEDNGTGNFIFLP